MPDQEIPPLPSTPERSVLLLLFHDTAAIISHNLMGIIIATLQLSFGVPCYAKLINWKHPHVANVVILLLFRARLEYLRLRYVYQIYRVSISSLGLGSWLVFAIGFGCRFVVERS